MRKLYLHIMVSLDGYIEGRGDDINWHNWNEEMDRYMMEFFQTVDLFIYGRKSYELMIGYWPHQTGEFADVMNKTPKLVLSKTLKRSTWNSKLIAENAAAEVAKLKQMSGKNMVLFAGAEAASVFINNNLIDEYRLILNPVVLSSGTALFKDMKQKMALNLIKAKQFDCGNVLLCYEHEK